MINSSMHSVVFNPTPDLIGSFKNTVFPTKQPAISISEFQSCKTRIESVISCVYADFWLWEALKPICVHSVWLVLSVSHWSKVPDSCKQKEVLAGRDGSMLGITIPASAQYLLAQYTQPAGQNQPSRNLQTIRQHACLFRCVVAVKL